MAHQRARVSAADRPSAQITRPLPSIMPILQEHPPDPAVPSQIAASSLERPQDLEYPHAPIPAKIGNPVMPLILWSMALLFGILICLVRLPLNAPPIDQLTLYTCDPLPPLPSLGSR